MCKSPVVGRTRRKQMWLEERERKKSNLRGRRKIYKGQCGALRSSIYPKNNGMSLNDLK